MRPVRRTCYRVAALAAAAALCAAGCAPHAASRPADQDPIASLAMPSSHVITADELAKVHSSSAYDAIREIRPLYLRSRGSQHAPMVAVDFMPRGPIEELRRIPTADVAEIRYLAGPVATLQFGSGHTGGVIVVVTRKAAR